MLLLVTLHCLGLLLIECWQALLAAFTNYLCVAVACNLITAVGHVPTPARLSALAHPVLQKQADEAAAQRAAADEQFKDVSEQLEAERSRVASLEVRLLGCDCLPALL